MKSDNTMIPWHPVLRPVARVLAAVLLCNALAPLSVLAQDKGTPAFNPSAQAQLHRFAAMQQDIERGKAAQAQNNASTADRTSRRLVLAHELVRELNLDASPASQPRPGKTQTQKRQQQQRLQSYLDGIDEDSATAQNEFEASRAELLHKRVSPEILARHDQAAQAMRERSQQLSRHTTAWRQNPSDLNLATLSRFFEQYPALKTASAEPTPSGPQAAQDSATAKSAKVPPKKLPWRTSTPSTRAPAETKTAWHQNLYADQKIRLAQVSGGAGGGIQFNIPPEPSQTPTPADLASTPETQITPALQAKATELGRNPVTIHNWVRNTISYVPTWGAIQSAQDTLDKKSGNAFDIASLEIALLRAAGIPARYQFGTIELPAAQVQNWVGGVTTPEAAQQLLGQGGIANRGITDAGRITTIRLEHIWVNAYVNWTPSRGAQNALPNATPSQHTNPNGPLNAWVPLDASYKQYSYSPGMDLKTNVPLDANALLNAAQTGATVNAAQGWVQNLNQTAIQAQLTAYQTRLQTYINSTPTGASSTVGDVIGKKIIPQRNHEMLAGTLPYKTILQGQESTAIPSALQHQFTYRLYASANDQASDTPVLTYTAKTSQLAGKRLTLSYIPATQADADLIASYLPKPHADGSPIQPSELPTSLPGYLIRLKAQINLDGKAVATAAQAVTMGTDLPSTGGFTELYDPTQWDLTSEESNTAGQATAIGISAGGISAAQLTQLKDRLSAAQTQLQAGNVTGLTGEQISGDILTATIWSWFAASESHNRLSQNQAGMVETPGLSYGLFHAVANPVYSWGVVRKVTFPGVNMDIGHVRNLSWNKDNNPATWIAYNRLRGQYMSALEGAIPERFFNDPEQCNVQGSSTALNPALPDCPQGISAMKALAVAAQTGQKIYTITATVYQNNPGIVNTALSAHSQSTKGKVQEALDAGYEVTIHEAPISQSGWTGAGYTVIDPSTGAGGYLIEGGSNGGFWKFVDDYAGFLGLLGVLIGFLPGSALIAAPYLLALSVTIALAVAEIGLIIYLDSLTGGPCDAKMIALYFGIVATLTALGAIVGSAFGAAMAAWVGGLIADGAIRSVTNSATACKS